MNVMPLVILYGLIGVGCAVTLAARRGRSARMVDLGLLLGFWPLYAPFVLLADAQEPTPEVPARQPGDDGGDLLDALRRAGGAPLASMLPDIETGRRLSQRLAKASDQVAEIDLLLARDAYREEAVRAQQEALRAAGDVRAADMIDSRLQIIRRLRVMRDRFASEIGEIRELLTLLQLQAELVRMAGDADSDTRDLLEQLVTRVQGLDELLATEDSLRGELDAPHHGFGELRAAPVDERRVPADELRGSTAA